MIEMDENERALVLDLGNLFKELREEACLTQRQAAQLVDSTQSRLSELENGKTDIKLLTILKWAGCYGYSVNISLEPIQDEETRAFNELLRQAMEEDNE